MSIFDEIIDGLKKAAEIAVSGGIDGGGIIPMLAEEPQKKTEIIGILAALHEVLGVAEHFTTNPAIKAIEQVGVEVFDAVSNTYAPAGTLDTIVAAKQDGAD